MLSIMEARPIANKEVLLEAYEYPAEVVFPMNCSINVGYLFLTANVEQTPKEEEAENSDNNLSNLSNSNNNSNLSHQDRKV